MDRIDDSLPKALVCRCGVLFLSALICYSQTKTSLELDVTKIGLRPRSEVVRILGRPSQVVWTWTVIHGVLLDTFAAT